MLVEKLGIPGQPKPTDPSLQCTAANDYWTSSHPHNATLEFSRDRKSMSVLCGYAAAEDDEDASRTCFLPLASYFLPLASDF